MAVTKDELMQAAVNEITNYPTIALRYQIGDPLILQGLASISAMLADLSNQVEMTAGEAFIKARPVTVLADAAVKGILPFATPTIASITLLNSGSTTVQVLQGRSLMDQGGRYWRVISGGTAEPGASVRILAKQVVLRSLTHSVTKNTPFYTVELDGPAVGYIAEVAVTGYEYTAEFCNVSPSDLVYHVKSDENQILSLMFGVDALAGKQPAVGESLAISIYDTEGEITLSVGGTFSFEYITAGDQFVTMTLAEVTQTGAAPMDIETMREVCSYPGIYSKSAVYLSNFDFLVRSQIQSLTFLSLWNETREEAVRGPDVGNINKLFVAVQRDGTSIETLRSEIATVVYAADDSYRLRWVDVVEIELPLVLTLTIPSTYDSAAVIQAVRALVLANYGRTSAWARRGGAKILRKDIYALIEKNIPALTQRLSDLSVDTSAAVTALPEHFRYVTDASLSVVPVSEDA